MASGTVFHMNPLESSLYLRYGLGEGIQSRLEEWDAALAAEPPLQAMRWHIYLSRMLRSATVTASTQIEGNPMSFGDVDALLQGDQVDAPRRAQVENINYNHSLELATAFALTPSFSWGESVTRVLNSEILRDLPDDRQGRYREGPVTVAGVFRPPDHRFVQSLMASLMDWLRESREHPLVRVALLHLNLVAIHPWLDGNGRTARVASSLEIMRCQVGAPELISVEPYLLENRDTYFDTLRETLGDEYRPERHEATLWIGWLVGVYVDRFAFRARMREAWPIDLGTIADALTRSSESLDWAPILLVAGIGSVRTRYVADHMLHRSLPTARAALNRMSRAEWLAPHGRGRGVYYVAGPRLLELSLRSPELIRRYVHGQTLGLVAP